MLSGKVLYETIIETNPPLILLLYYPFVWIAEKIQLNAVLLIWVSTFVGCIFSAYAASCIARCSAAYEKQEKSLFLLFFSTLVLVPNLAAEYSQKEHLVFVLCLPYLCTFLPSVHTLKKNYTPFLYISAGIGFCLKPHFFLVFAALVFLRRYFGCSEGRWLEKNELYIPLIGGVYCSIIILFFPAFFSLLPLILKTYPYYYAFPGVILIRFVFKGYALLLLAYISFPLKTTKQGKDRLWFITISLLFFLEAIIQYKPWPYLTLPSFLAAVIACGLYALEQQIFWKKLVYAGILACCFSSITQRVLFADGLEKSIQQQKDFIYLSKEKGYDSAYIFSETFFNGMPYLFDADLKLSARYHSMWMLRGIYQNPLNILHLEPLPDRQAVSEKIYDDFNTDFSASPPDMLLFDTGDSVNSLKIDYKSWLLKDTRLAKFFSAYRFDRVLDTCNENVKFTCRFDVYTK